MSSLTIVCRKCGSNNTDRGPSGTIWCLSCDAMVQGPDKTTAPAPTRYEVHPAADVFPMMSEAEFLLLKADIEANGQHESIVFWQEQLLDGRNRLRACTELGIEPDTCELDDDDDPFAYVISANIHRRHLEVGQRSLIAAKLASMKRGDAKSQRDDRQNCLSQTEAAELLNVSPRSVKSAKAVLDSGSQSVIEAIEQRDLSVSLAEKLCKSVPDQKKQAKIVRGGRDAVKAATAEPKSKPSKRPQPTQEPSSPTAAGQDLISLDLIGWDHGCAFQTVTGPRLATIIPHAETDFAFLHVVNINTREEFGCMDKPVHRERLPRMLALCGVTSLAEGSAWTRTEWSEAQTQHLVRKGEWESLTSNNSRALAVVQRVRLAVLDRVSSAIDRFLPSRPASSMGDYSESDVQAHADDIIRSGLISVVCGAFPLLHWESHSLEIANWLELLAERIPACYRRHEVAKVLGELGPDCLHRKSDFDYDRTSEPGVSDRALTDRYYAHDAEQVLRELPGGDGYLDDRHFETRRLLGHLCHEHMVDAARHIIEQRFVPVAAKKYIRGLLADDLENLTLEAYVDRPAI